MVCNKILFFHLLIRKMKEIIHKKAILKPIPTLRIRLRITEANGVRAIDFARFLLENKF